MTIGRLIASSAILSVVGSQLIVASNPHPNPLNVFSSRTHKVTKHRTTSAKKVVRYVASKRSLASYGRMPNEYIGPTNRTSELTKPVDVSKYNRYTPIGNVAIDMKHIDGPMPEDYARLAIKSKTLLNPAKNEIKIVINKSNQRMYVYEDFKHLYTFKVSTGRSGHNTPTGVFKPYSAEQMHYSRKYYNSPMPWSVFFNGGVAIHGTEAIGNLGRRASHGCVRTHPKSARKVYNIVRKYGMENTKVIVKN